MFVQPDKDVARKGGFSYANTVFIIHRRKKAASESSMGETEDEHNEKFSNLKRDGADSGKKKSVGFTVGQGEVKYIYI